MAEKNRSSFILTNKELEIIQNRLKGNMSDPTGVFSRRIRPKLKEILVWSTHDMRKKLKTLLKQQRVTDDTSHTTTAPVKQKEVDFEEFKKKYGY